MNKHQPTQKSKIKESDCFFLASPPWLQKVILPVMRIWHLISIASCPMPNNNNKKFDWGDLGLESHPFT